MLDAITLRLLASVSYLGLGPLRLPREAFRSHYNHMYREKTARKVSKVALPSRDSINNINASWGVVEVVTV